jgi:molecular chaperone GrpE
MTDNSQNPENEQEAANNTSAPEQATAQDADATSAPEDNVEQLLTPEAQIMALQAELAETKERTMRALADAENTRKRAIKDRNDAGNFAIANFARDLLGFSDNFKRALEAIPSDLKDVDPRLENLIEGISAMRRELISTFDRHGIQKIEPMDELFDPNFHEVMFETPMPGKQNGQIIQVIEPGYVIKDRLLRAAKVGLAKAVDQEGPTDPGTKVDIQG